MTIHEGTPLATFVDSALRMVGLHNDPYLTIVTFPPNVRGVGNPLPLRQTNLNVHSWIIGQTGMGKSYHIISQMRQLLAQGVGFSFIDLHDTCGLLLSQLVAEGFFDDENNRSRVIFVEFLEDGPGVCH